MAYLHPALHRPSPTIEAIMADATPAAQSVLAMARRLALARQLRIERIDEALAVFAGASWLEGEVSRPWISRALTPSDLIRAMMIEERSWLAEAFRAGEAFHDEARRVRDDLQRVEASSQWASVSARAVAIEPRWARQWILARRLHPRPRVDLVDLLDWVPTSARALLVQRFDEVELLGTSQNPLCFTFDAATPAYWERHGGIEAIERELSETRGVFIVGTEGSGRRALVDACAWRARLRDGPAPLHGLELWWAPSVHSGYWREGSLLQKHVDWFNGSLDRGETRPAITVFPGLETALWEGSLQKLMDKGTPRDRFVIIATPAEMEEARRCLSVTHAFRNICVPELRASDHITLWVCHFDNRRERGLSELLWLAMCDPGCFERSASTPRPWSISEHQAQRVPELAKRDPGVRAAAEYLRGERGGLTYKWRGVLERFEITRERWRELDELIHALGSNEETVTASSSH